MRYLHAGGTVTAELRNPKRRGLASLLMQLVQLIIVTVVELYLHVLVCPHDNKNKQTPWPESSESASELYWPSDRLWSAKLVATFSDKGCCVVSTTDPYDCDLGFLDRNCCCFFFSCTHEAEWTPFHIHYFSENLVVPGIEPGPLDL
jgi:hypothetical protein